jgi:hypothetical protein
MPGFISFRNTLSMCNKAWIEFTIGETKQLPLIRHKNTVEPCYKNTIGTSKL